MAVRSALEIVPKSAGVSARYVVSLEVGTDAAVMDDGGLREAVRERLKAEGRINEALILLQGEMATTIEPNKNIRLEVKHGD